MAYSSDSRTAKLDRGAVAQASTVSIGGEPAVTLVRPGPLDKNKPQFLEATVLPGEGMNLLQLEVYLPGKGDIDVIAAPSLPEAKKILEEGNDSFGNKGFTIGGAILLPYPNRIRGTLSPDGKTLATTIAGKQVSLPANWQGKNPGAEVHAMHGLILNAKFEDVRHENGPAESSVSGVLHAGNFGGHWLSETDVSVKTTLKAGAVDIVVTTKNVGKELLPMAIGWHPYFEFPSGDRQQARLHLPADTRAMVTNYDDVFPTGQLVSVKGTPYDFTAPGGAPLGKLFMDDCFTHVKRGADGSSVIEIVDPAAKYGLRIVSLSPQIKSIQVYAPPEKNYVAVEPQFNLADPYNQKIWGKADTGMVSLQPDQSVTWHVRLELFTPAK
jgi:galactose mutarotase-like enzyme